MLCANIDSLHVVVVVVMVVAVVVVTIGCCYCCWCFCFCCCNCNWGYYIIIIRQFNELQARYVCAPLAVCTVITPIICCHCKHTSSKFIWAKPALLKYPHPLLPLDFSLSLSCAVHLLYVGLFQSYSLLIDGGKTEKKENPCKLLLLLLLL